MNTTIAEHKAFAYWKDELQFYWKNDKLRSWDTFLKESTVDWNNWIIGGTK